MSKNPLRLSLLLLGLAVALYVYLAYVPSQKEPMWVQGAFPELPEVVTPQGELLEVFRRARPASLQIEVRSGDLAFHAFPQGIGTGFFISPDGLVLTAYHVVDPTTARLPGRERFVAVGPDETRYPLELVGFDAYLDLALLQAEVHGEVPYLPLAGGPPEVGSEVLAIGNSRGEFLGGRVGEVTRLGVRALRAEFADDTVELTAALAPGDSGGPVLNARGEVVGVVSYISLTPGFGNPDAPPGAEGFVPPFLRGLRLSEGFASYAVPVSSDSEVVADLRAGAQRDVPVIGFEIGTRTVGPSYNPRDGRGLELGPRPGVVVGRVAPGGPAARAGLRSAVEEPVYDRTGALCAVRAVVDVIVAVDGERTPTVDALVRVLRGKEVGQQVEVRVQRGDTLQTLTLELGARRAVFSE